MRIQKSKSVSEFPFMNFENSFVFLGLWGHLAGRIGGVLNLTENGQKLFHSSSYVYVCVSQNFVTNFASEASN
jgi:hypothetical protein